MPVTRAHRCAAVLLTGVLFAGLTGSDEGTLTIVGSGKGSVTVVEKDGRVTTVDPATIPLNLSRPRTSPSPPEQPSDDPAEKPAAPTPTEESDDARKAEAARIAAAAKAAEEERRAKAKETANYQDKEYTYGPGSASKVDRTGTFLQEQKQGRSAFSEPRPKAQSLRNESPKPTGATTQGAAGDATVNESSNP